MEIILTAVFQKFPEGYVGFVEELPDANTQGRTLEETRTNLEEAWLHHPTRLSGFAFALPDLRELFILSNNPYSMDNTGNIAKQS